MDDWEKWGEEIPLLVNLQPAGDHLGEGFFQAGGVPVVMKELSKQNKINNDAIDCHRKDRGRKLDKHQKNRK